MAAVLGQAPAEPPQALAIKQGRAMRKLALFALPFGAGILLCLYLLPANGRLLAAAAGVLAALASPALPKREGRVLRIAASGFALGILWLSGYEALALSPAEALAGTESVAVVEVAGYAEETSYGARCAVRMDGLWGRAVFYGDRSLLELEPGNRVTAAVKYGSAATLSGEESGYYISQGVFLRLYSRDGIEVEEGRAGSLRYLPQRLARRLKESAAALYSEPARGFITALLTGDRTGLDKQSLSHLAGSGLLHITAVSGLHCGFLVGLLGLVALRRQRLTAALGFPVLLLYMAMTGYTPPVVRACVMAGLFLLAPLLGREADALSSLSAALLVILAANPFAAASVSLQMSFAAVAGILLPAPRIYAALDAHRPPRLGRAGSRAWRFSLGVLSASLGVMLLTTPLSAVYFGSVSLVAPAANLLTLWMAPALFACALLGTALCTLLPPLEPLAVLMEGMARYVLWVARLLARLPGHSVAVTGPVAVMWLLLVYTMLGVCALSKDRRRKYVFAAVTAAVCLAAAKALPVWSIQDDALDILAVDVGQGAATLLHSQGHTALVDCGSLRSFQDAGESVAGAMESYGWNRLDYVVLTHYHEDHAGGLERLLARVEAGMLLLPQLMDSGDQAVLQQEVLSLAGRYGIPVSYIEELVQVELGGAVLTLYPPVAEGDMNERGLAALGSVGRFDMLITGDMGAGTERALAAAYSLPDIEVLLAGHHGSKYSTSEELLEAVTPEAGIISVGENSFGHPTDEALGRMAAAGMAVYRTDLHGNILIRVRRAGGG